MKRIIKKLLLFGLASFLLVAPSQSLAQANKELAIKGAIKEVYGATFFSPGGGRTEIHLVLNNHPKKLLLTTLEELQKAGVVPAKGVQSAEELKGIKIKVVCTKSEVIMGAPYADGKALYDVIQIESH